MIFEFRYVIMLIETISAVIVAATQQGGLGLEVLGLASLLHIEHSDWVWSPSFWRKTVETSFSPPGRLSLTVISLSLSVQVLVVWTAVKREKH